MRETLELLRSTRVRLLSLGFFFSGFLLLGILVYGVPFLSLDLTGGTSLTRMKTGISTQYHVGYGSDLTLEVTNLHGRFFAKLAGALIMDVNSISAADPDGYSGTTYFQTLNPGNHLLEIVAADHGTAKYDVVFKLTIKKEGFPVTLGAPYIWTNENPSAGEAVRSMNIELVVSEDSGTNPANDN